MLIMYSAVQTLHGSAEPIFAKLYAHFLKSVSPGGECTFEIGHQAWLYSLFSRQKNTYIFAAKMSAFNREN